MLETEWSGGKASGAPEWFSWLRVAFEEEQKLPFAMTLNFVQDS